MHRDFKPDNVLLAADGPRVVDFGIARIIDATGTITSRAVGTPAYMAPEQIAGERRRPAADVFAWGATMSFAATGQAAFGGRLDRGGAQPHPQPRGRPGRPSRRTA